MGGNIKRIHKPQSLQERENRKYILRALFSTLPFLCGKKERFLFTSHFNLKTKETSEVFTKHSKSPPTQ
jgi:hypothetical protein